MDRWVVFENVWLLVSRWVALESASPWWVGVPFEGYNQDTSVIEFTNTPVMYPHELMDTLYMFYPQCSPPKETLLMVYGDFGIVFAMMTQYLWATQ